MKLDRVASSMRSTGLFIALTAAMVKALSIFGTFPGWDFDPFVLVSPRSGLGPTGSMIADTCIACGSIAMLIGAKLTNIRMRWLEIGLALVGILAVVSHLRTTEPLGNHWVGSAWVAAMLLGLGVSHVSVVSEHRRAVMAVFAGLVALLAVRGAHQYWMEHPRTVRDFQQNKETFLAAQGWTAESPMAKAYERRLVQAEATGWFGLANVYATLASAGVTLAGVGAAGAWRRRSTLGPDGPPHGREWIVLGAVTATSLVALWMAGAKGGYAAVAMGIGAGCVFGWIGGRRWSARKVGQLGGAVSLASLAGVMALVIARGMVGDRVHELSLLFRWFYMQAAVKIGLHGLPLGVGPDGFQSAYLLAKNPLSPEEVTSSHNMLMDWWATLGVGGLAWIAVWGVWVWRAGRNAALRGPDHQVSSESLFDDGHEERQLRWFVAGIGAAAALIATRLDPEPGLVDVLIIRVGGLVAFVAASWGVLAASRDESSRTWAPVALGAAAIAAAAHGLIDVTGVWVPSAAWLMMLVGAAGAVPRTPAEASAPLHRKQAAPSLAIAALALAGLIVTIPWRIARWEHGLTQASAAAEPVADFRTRLDALAPLLARNDPQAQRDAGAIANELSALTTKQIRSSKDLSDAMLELDRQSTTKTGQMMSALSAAFPSDWKTRREASRVYVRLAALLDSTGDAKGANEARVKAEAIADSAPAPEHRNASEFAWLALTREALFDATKDPKWGEKAIEALQSAAGAAPYDLEQAKRLMKLSMKLKDEPKARYWARKVLELDGLMKYDRETRGLSRADRDDALLIASEP